MVDQKTGSDGSQGLGIISRDLLPETSLLEGSTAFQNGITKNSNHEPMGGISDSCHMFVDRASCSQSFGWAVLQRDPE